MKRCESPDAFRPMFTSLNSRLRKSADGLAIEEVVAYEPRVRRRSPPQTLQSLVNTAYDNGRYVNDLDYTTMPDPPLKAEEQAWIADYLKSKAPSVPATL